MEFHHLSEQEGRGLNTLQGHLKASLLVLFKDSYVMHSPRAASVEIPSALFLHLLTSHQHNEAAAMCSKNIARSLESAT